MINVSNEFKEIMEERRDFKSYAEIQFPDGEELLLDSSQFTAENNCMADGAGQSIFPIGIALQKYIQIEILNDVEQYKDYSFVGATIQFYLELKLSESKERIEKGTYTVITPETYGETVIITAYDDMYKADKEYTTSLKFPQTAGTVLQDACQNCGIYCGSSTFLHDDFIIKSKPSGKYREIIGYIAMIACGNARIDVKNSLQIMTYDFSGWEIEGGWHRLNEFTAPKIEYNDTVITGLKTTVTKEVPVYDEDNPTEEVETEEQEEEILVGTDDYIIEIDNPLIEGQEETVMSWLFEKIGNIRFRKFSGDAISNPLIEFMDLAKVQDRRGRNYNTFITDVLFLMPGYTTLKNDVPLISSIKYTSDAEKIEKKSKKLVEKEKAERKEEIKKLKEDKLSFIVFTNTDAIEIDDQKSKSVLNIRFIVAKTTHVAIDMEILLSVETTETESGELNWIENDAVVMATYYLDGEEVELRHPVETWQDGRHILHLRYDIQTIDAAIHTWGVWLTVNGGSVRIEPYAIHAVIMGTGMAAEEKWDGTIDAWDDVPRFSFDIFKGMQDIVKVVNHEPVKSEIADGVGKIDFLSMFRGIQDSIDATADIMVYSPWINNDKVVTECTYDSKVGWIGNGELSSGTALTVTTVPMHGVTRVEQESVNAVFYASFDNEETWLGWTEEGWIETPMDQMKIEAVPESAWAQGGETVQIRVVLEKNASLSELNVYGGKIDA